ncbi:unnamed protein product, partial [Nesidiocoris tenuis]
MLVYVQNASPGPPASHWSLSFVGNREKCVPGECRVDSGPIQSNEPAPGGYSRLSLTYQSSGQRNSIRDVRCFKNAHPIGNTAGSDLWFTTIGSCERIVPDLKKMRLIRRTLKLT